MDGPLRVLIADDVDDVRALLRINLETDGRFEVIGEAADGAQALALAARHNPDAVILDLSMPVMDGEEIIPKLRAQAPDTKILVYSAFQGFELRNALQQGAHVVVEKGSSTRGDLITELVGLCRPEERASP